jgi:hypothetical protein
MDGNKANLKRRHFLVTLGAGGAGAVAAAAAVAGKAGSAAAGVPQAADDAARPEGISEHMRKYYRSARI